MKNDDPNKTQVLAKDKTKPSSPNPRGKTLPNTQEQELLDTQEQELLNTGPDAIIGYSEATGEPLTKQQVFGAGNQPGRANQRIHSGPELTGSTQTKRTKPVTALEELRSHRPQTDNPINPGAVNQYETQEGSRGGWHSADSQETPGDNKGSI